MEIRRRCNFCGSGTGNRTPIPWLRKFCVSSVLLGNPLRSVGRLRGRRTFSRAKFHVFFKWLRRFPERPTCSTLPRRTLSSAARISGTSGRRSGMRLDGASTTTTPNGRTEMSCWYSSFPSIVTKASVTPLARFSRSPFLAPASRGLARWIWNGQPRRRSGRAGGSRQAVRARVSRVSRARSSAAMACSRRTDGNCLRNSSSVSPPSM